MCITYFLHLKGHRCLASLVSANAMQATIGFNSCYHRYHRISVFCCRVTRCIAIPKEFDAVFPRLFQHRLFHWFQLISIDFDGRLQWTNLRRSGFPQVVFPSLCLMYSVKRQNHSNDCDCATLSSCLWNAKPSDETEKRILLLSWEKGQRSI